MCDKTLRPGHKVGPWHKEECPNCSREFYVTRSDGKVIESADDLICSDCIDYNKHSSEIARLESEIERLKSQPTIYHWTAQTSSGRLIGGSIETDVPISGTNEYNGVTDRIMRDLRGSANGVNETDKVVITVLSRLN